jgi:hypothetical protein
MKHLIVSAIFLIYSAPVLSQSISHVTLYSYAGNLRSSTAEVSVSINNLITGAIGNSNITLTDASILQTDVITALEKTALVEFDFFPNPTSESLKITVPDQSGQLYIISVYSVHGQLMCSHESSTALTIDMKDYPSGIYFIQLQSKTERINTTTKIMKL